MREISFRGKRLDNNEWEYGYLCRYGFAGKEKYYIIPYYASDLYAFEVDSETVGQFTGLTDKNGKKIFEGDILKIAVLTNGIGTYFFPPLDYPVKVVVKWSLCAWMWETICKDKYYINFPEAWCHYECEVIGNIHDNPELLEVQDD